MACGRGRGCARPESGVCEECCVARFFAPGAMPAYTLSMKLAALVLVLVAACQAGGGDDYPPGPGGGGRVIGGNGNGGGGSDAGTGDSGDAGDGDAGVQITGRVCILKDLRTLTVCDDAVDASVLT